MRDAIGTTLEYWPLTMVAGTTSETLDFTIDNPGGPTAKLAATFYENVKVWAKKVGDISFVNITDGEYDLSAIGSGPQDFQCYVIADSGIESFERDPVSLIVGSSSAAGWVV